MGGFGSGINGSGATLLTNISASAFSRSSRMLARRTQDCFFVKPCPGRDVRDTTMSNIWVMNADRSDVTSHHQTHRWGGARPLTLMTADDLCGRRRPKDE